jgi:hypothetical protein
MITFQFFAFGIEIFSFEICFGFRISVFGYESMRTCFRLFWKGFADDFRSAGGAIAQTLSISYDFGGIYLCRFPV